MSSGRAAPLEALLVEHPLVVALGVGWIFSASVGNAPGAIALTVIPSGPTSCASARVKPTTPPFDET